MTTIYAIGGGEIGRRETYEIDKHLVSLANKERPHLLFVPTASHDDQSYIDVVCSLYGELGCEVKALCLYDEPSKEQIEGLIDWADIVYVGGGSTPDLLIMWESFKIKPLLQKAADRGAILAGLSAGLNCFFKKAYCDGTGPTDEPLFWKDGLAFLPYASCPHYNLEVRKTFDAKLKATGLPGYAVEDNVALIFQDGKLVGNWKSWGHGDGHAYYLHYVRGKLFKKTVA